MAVFLYPMVESSLPEETLIAWQRSPLNGRDGTAEKPPKSQLDYLMEFLRKEVENEDQRVLVHSGFTTTSKDKKTHQLKKQIVQSEEIPTAAGLFTADKSKCMFCDKGHESRECVKAQEMSLQEKNKLIQDKKCCYSCLRQGHRSKGCKSFIKCHFCGKRHLIIMCPDLPIHKKTNHSANAPRADVGQVSSTTLSCCSKVILKTLLVTIVGPSGKKQVRALIDDGSQRSYITRKLVDEVGLKAVGQEDMIHALFTGVQTAVQKHNRYEVRLESAKGRGLHKFKALDQEKICGRIPRMTKGPWMRELKQRKIWLTDIGDDCPEISILIGADVIGSLLTGNIIQLSNGLTAVETTLGWTLMGRAGDREECSSESLAMTVTSLFVTEASVEELWSLETIGIRDPAEHKTKEEKEADIKKHFLDTVTRAPDGRYSVSLPWIDGAQKIPDNRFIAEKRLQSTTRKLLAESRYEDYDNIFKDWLQEGIIEEVHASEFNDASHYLPHRAVIKPGSMTTPVRPVFDASCKTQRNPSLNECLEKGPNLLEQVPSVLLRFREGKIGVISDIRKAFQMIEVKKEDRDFLRFLWWEDAAMKNYKTYRHRRVVFGVNCSPFLLGAVIEYHLSHVEEGGKAVAQKLQSSLYVDNCVVSLDTVEECMEFKEESCRVMADAKMELRQWECGGSGDVSGIGQLASRWCGLDADRTVEASLVTSVLGLKWNKKEDTLSIEYDPASIPEKITKRIILSFTHKIFDPIGFSCPITLQPKLMLQKLWKDKKGWDEEVPIEVQEKFNQWCGGLHLLEKIKIPRNSTGNVSSHKNWQIHTFCDASQDAYAAVVFLRTVEDSTVSVQLLQAKSRVSPVKTTSIPRLELLSCTVAARLTRSVMDALSLENVPTFYWSDSTTALAWIRRNDDWGTFVGNRVKEICKLTDIKDWRHVSGTKNPADLPSRGCTTNQLLESRWWEGPEWLKRPQEEWCTAEGEVDEDAVSNEQKRKASINLLTLEDGDQWYTRRSSYRINIAILGWIRRFITNARGRIKICGPLSVNEIEEAEKSLLRIVQHESFSIGEQEFIGGIRVLKDKEGIIRVKTKLMNREDTYGFKYPAVLPNKHILVDQLIREEHINNNHAGVQFLMGNLREKFWILQGRRAVRRVVDQCTICKRFTTKKPHVVPAPLPENRVKSAKVFEVTGVDLAGPLYLKTKEKAWIVLFTCAVYRCVHLELIRSLSTEAFLDALSRFTDRRGRPEIIYSDNGTNFLGAVNVFKELDWSRILNECGMKRIQWKFNPPSAAWGVDGGRD